jgi:methionine-R-sulfoxide reductase
MIDHYFINQMFLHKLSKLSFNDKVGLGLIVFAVLILGVATFGGSSKGDHQEKISMDAHMNDLATELTQKQKIILYQNGTEIPYTSDLVHEKRKGTYYAVDTKKAVFRSEDKFDSGTGWPSFVKPIAPEAVHEEEDVSGGMSRTGIMSTAGGHLGHVFPDGPKDKTGLRYCINGAVLYFVPDEE